MFRVGPTGGTMVRDRGAPVSRVRPVAQGRGQRPEDRTEPLTGDGAVAGQEAVPAEFRVFLLGFMLEAGEEGGLTARPVYFYTGTDPATDDGSQDDGPACPYGPCATNLNCPLRSMGG